MKRRSAPRGAPALTLCVALVSTALVAVAAGDAGVLALAPALLIALLLSRRRYPGAQLLAGRRSIAVRRSPGNGLEPLRAATRALFAAPRGGLLLARSLAVRPPPALLPAR